MMLAEIQRKLANRQKEIEMQKKDAVEVKKNQSLPAAARVPGAKVVAIEVDPELYERLQEIAKKHNVRGVRGALMLAAKTGTRHL